MPPMEAVQFLSAFLIALAALLWFLPVGTCKQCPHCKAEKAAAVERKHVKDHQFSWWRCPDDKCSRNPAPPLHICGYVKCPHSGEVH